MRNGTWFMKLSIVVIVAAVFVVAAAVDTSSAAPAAEQATDVATTGPLIPTYAASRFPLCQPIRPTTAVTPQAPASTPDSSATMPGATTPAVANPTVYIGLYVSNVDHCGARVQSVMRNSPARTAGLLTGDVIVAVNGTALGGSSDLLNTVQMAKAGDVLTLTVQRRIRPQRPGRQATATPEATEAAAQSQIASNIVEIDIPVTVAPYPGKGTPAPIATEAATTTP